MSKVYLVSEGEYSDYRVLNVFTTEALAKEWIGDFTHYDIEERNLDDMSDRMITKSIKVTMNLYTGEVIGTEPISQEVEEHTYYRDISLLFNQSFIVGSTPQFLIVMCVDGDKDRAIKVCAEKRAQMLTNIREFYGDKLKFDAHRPLVFDRQSCLVKDKK